MRREKFAVALRDQQELDSTMSSISSFKLSVETINESENKTENIASVTYDLSPEQRKSDTSSWKGNGSDPKEAATEKGNSKTSNLSNSSGSSFNSIPDTRMTCLSDENHVSFGDIDLVRVNDEEKDNTLLDEMEQGEKPRRKRQSSSLTQMTHSLRKSTMNMGKTIAKGAYAKKEGMFVFATAAVLAFNCGFANGATMSGFLTNQGNGSSVLVSGFAGSYTKSALNLAKGDIEEFGFFTNLILSYMFGNFCVGFIAPDPVAWSMQPAYGPTFLLGGVFELIASLLAFFEFEERAVFFFACAATGVQNGIASSYSANLLRCATTGASTDLALCIGRIVRGNRKDVWRAYVLFTICFFFWLGGLIAFYAARVFLSATLFVNAILFFVMGIGLIVFLVYELNVSVQAAILGTWKWKETMDKIVKSQFGDNFTEEEFRNMFNEIDTDGSGEITADELLEYLMKSGIGISVKEVKVLMKFADSNGDGLIDRDEWAEICDKFLKDQDAVGTERSR